MLFRLFLTSLIYPTIVFSVLLVRTLANGGSVNFLFFELYLLLVLVNFLYLFLLELHCEKGILHFVYRNYFRRRSVSVASEKINYAFTRDYHFKKRITIYQNGDKFLHEFDMTYTNITQIARILDGCG